MIGVYTEVRLQSRKNLFLMEPPNIYTPRRVHVTVRLSNDPIIHVCIMSMNQTRVHAANECFRWTAHWNVGMKRMPRNCT